VGSGVDAPHWGPGVGGPIAFRAVPQPDQKAFDELARECYAALTEPDEGWAEIPVVLHRGRTPQEAELDHRIHRAIQRLWGKEMTPAPRASSAPAHASRPRIDQDSRDVRLSDRVEVGVRRDQDGVQRVRGRRDPEVVLLHAPTLGLGEPVEGDV